MEPTSSTSIITLLTTAWDPALYDTLAVIFLLFTTLHGALRGLIKEVATLLCLLASYLLAYPFGWLAFLAVPKESIPTMLWTPLLLFVGSILGYIITAISIAIVLRVLKWRKKKWKGKAWWIIRIGGALLGMGFGLLLLLIISWYILIVGALTETLLSPLQDTLDLTNGQQMEDAGKSILPVKTIIQHRIGMKESIIGKFAEYTNPIPEEITSTAQSAVESIVELSKNPEQLQELIEQEPVQELMKTDTIQNLLEDEEVKKMAAEGDIMGLINHPAIKQAMNDPEVMEKIKNVDIKSIFGMEDDTNVEDLSEEDLQKILEEVDVSP